MRSGMPRLGLSCPISPERIMRKALPGSSMRSGKPCAATSLTIRIRILMSCLMTSSMEDEGNPIIKLKDAMKKILFILLLFAVSEGQVFFAQQVPARPDPPRRVNDIAHVMTADQVSALEGKLDAYDDSTSNQIVIVTVPSAGD